MPWCGVCRTVVERGMESRSPVLQMVAGSRSFAVRGALLRCHQTGLPANVIMCKRLCAPSLPRGQRAHSPVKFEHLLRAWFLAFMCRRPGMQLQQSRDPWSTWQAGTANMATFIGTSVGTSCSSSCLASGHCCVAGCSLELGHQGVVALASDVLF